MLFGPAPSGAGHLWTGILAALQAVSRERSEQSEQLLRRLLTEFQGRLALDEGAGLSHAMPPEDLLRSLAVQTLAAWDLPRHRDAIIPHAHPARRDILGTIARRSLAG